MIQLPAKMLQYVHDCQSHFSYVVLAYIELSERLRLILFPMLFNLHNTMYCNAARQLLEL